LIPVASEKKEQAVADAVEAEVPVFVEPDPMLQLTILRELSTLMETKPNFNLVLEMVLEGIYRGIGMDRTLFALRTPDHRFLAGRYALGLDNERLRTQFQVETVDRKPNLFTHVIKTLQPVWVKADEDAAVRKLLTPEVQAISKGSPFFVAPIEIRKKVIGIFYADRHVSGRPLDEDSFTSFKHFAHQGNLALTFLNGA